MPTLRASSPRLFHRKSAPSGAAAHLCLDVLTKTKQPELHRYCTTRDRAANLRLFRLVSEVLRAIDAGAFHPVVGWQCQTCPYQRRCWAWNMA